MGAPDLALQLPSDFTVAADKMEDSQEFTLPTGITEAAVGPAPSTSCPAPPIHRPQRRSICRRSERRARKPAPRTGAGAGARAAGCRARMRRPHDGIAFRLPAGAQLGGAHPLQEDVAVRRQGADRSQHGRRLLSPRTARRRRAELLTLRARRHRRSVGATRIRPSRFSSDACDEDVQALAAESRRRVRPNISAADGRGAARRIARADDPAEHARRLGPRRYWFERPHDAAARHAHRGHGEAPTIRTSSRRPSVAPGSAASRGQRSRSVSR